MQLEQKREVDALISQLEAAGCSQQPRPLQNPLLFGNYNVAYTSSGDDQRGQRECSRRAAVVSHSPTVQPRPQVSEQAWRRNDPAVSARQLNQQS
jgi:hypothetical protein